MTQQTNNKVNNPGGILIDPLMTRPDHVAIVALGHSSQSFIREQMGNGGMKKPFDEVWTVNRGLRAFPHDKLFLMDDLRWIEQERSKEYAEFLKNHDKPIITSTPYIEYPMSVEYPFAQVMDFIEDDVFAVNTVSYAVAYAMSIGVKEISLYGADFVYANKNTAEAGGMAVAYLLGLCRMHNIVHRLPGETTMLYADTVRHKANGTMGRPLYGYHRIDEMKKKKQLEEHRKQIQQQGLK